MSYPAYDYARYEGDSRSAWERLSWIHHKSNYEIELERTSSPMDVTIESVLVNVEVETTWIEDKKVSDDVVNDDVAIGSDVIDMNWRNWDVFDFITVAGIVLLVAGFVTAFIPRLSAGGMMVPIGLACMALAAYGARRRDTLTT